MKMRKGYDARKTAAALWAGVSHDLRQPIQSLLLLVDLAGRTQDAGVLAQTRGYMEQQLLSLQEMVEATGVLARLEAGLMAPRRQKSRLSDLLGDAGAAVSGHSGVDVVFDVAGEDTIIEGDRALLGLAVSGLVQLALIGQAGTVVGVTGQRRDEQTTITLDYVGVPLRIGEREGFFVDFTGAQRGRVALGFAFLERLAVAIGFSASARTMPQGRQRFVLVSLPTAAPKTRHRSPS